jgi:hypothetical protein
MSIEWSADKLDLAEAIPLGLRRAHQPRPTPRAALSIQALGG